MAQRLEHSDFDPEVRGSNLTGGDKIFFFNIFKK